ncbi:MAG: TonB-dependent receptor, partial [Bacteroidales bacterium]|nr:TonB-dependent receptor [Bacteroidales bacterium]
MKCSKKILVLAGIIAGFESYGQEIKFSDTVKIKEVVITSNRLQEFTSGNKIQEIDSAALVNDATNSLSELISSQTQVQMNSYGTGGLATPSLRGTGAAHTAVLWNGFNMQDVQNALVDFSRIPVFLVDDIKLQYGGCSALYGSGAIGGAISMNNNLLFNKGTSATFVASYGSFMNYFEGAECRISEKKFAGAVRIFDNSIKNNFEYVNKYKQGFPLLELENSQTKQQGVLIDNSILINEKQKLNFHFWLQNNNHNIPAAMNAFSESLAKQSNQSIKRTAEWCRVGNKAEYYLRGGYFNNYEYYDDPSYNIQANHSSATFISEFENNIKFNSNFKLNSGVNYTNEKCESSDFNAEHFRDRTTIFTSLRYNTLNGKFKTVLSLREEIINNENTPLTYSFGSSLEILKGLNIKGNINKSYRIPSFNDLFWYDAAWNMYGNPDLKSENGFNEELSLNYKLKLKKISAECGITGYSGDITNWIMWMPIDNYAKWMPMNVDTVWSRGLEFNLGFTLNAGDFNMKIYGNYSIIKTTNESESAPDSIIHKQL